MAIPVSRLNHAVLFVRDLDRSVEFYRSAFDFEEIAREGGQMAFLRAKGSSNHHDLGLMQVGANAPRPARGSTGLYHLAWEVPTIADLQAAQAVLANLGALTGQSDHGATKSLYGADPDGNEFEVMWMVPRRRVGRIRPPRGGAAVAHGGGGREASVVAVGAPAADGVARKRSQRPGCAPSIVRIKRPRRGAAPAH